MKKYVFISILVVGVLAAAYFLLLKKDEADASSILNSLLSQNGNGIQPPKIEDFLRPTEEAEVVEVKTIPTPKTKSKFFRSGLRVENENNRTERSFFTVDTGLSFDRMR